MPQGPTGNHKSQETYVTVTPPAPIVDVQHPDPGYVKQARTLQVGPQGSTSPGVSHAWPDSFQRP